ncbi:3-oxoacyl-(acyl-carrier-protein) synthase [Tenacibaculum sp. MAR_2009_124]|uniref:beta-ketoacyl synthase N-terminal-like domain-containing protein n=1 Tax=Tenacibaculum sp. MAR_2009_124 TaxID=1250059 RepID=UPI00089BC25C|nr:beta-ketoacyl synthase N-terminal-like domain-containing protein [Tenacibaculum sp. MAR_2009_124]SEC27296.1 3-oxoacyl-(acyl-carrier-protein) synthase [Tenacibaculum sp. MAR_2009_124]
MNRRISITSIASLSALGSTFEEIWDNYNEEKHFLNEREYENFNAWVAELKTSDRELVQELSRSDLKYKDLDDSVLYALFVARRAINDAQWKPVDNFGINIGSSRGATSLFEKYHQEYLETGKSSTISSPTTTLGNISSWIAHDLQTNGPEISHSITCSTGLHSLLNGVAWILSGMTNKFLVGGSEASLTGFTIAQMKALKVYANNQDNFPCKALDQSKKKNTMVLGEGASVVCLEDGEQENALAIIEGVGYATEVLKHNISISTNADCFQKSMRMALGDNQLNDIDAIVMHAPGTIKGDESELNAIKKVFGSNCPFLTTNKWKLGHTFATSGLLSLELAILMIQNQKVIHVPFIEKQQEPKNINKVLINAVGFGGNAVSVLISKKA